MTMTTPATPTITAAENTAAGRITVTVTGQDSAPLATNPSRTFRVQRSRDGAAWETMVVGDAQTTTQQAHTRLDVAVPLGQSARYRARAEHDGDVSAWSSTTPSVVRSAPGWWLQCPARPALGRQVHVADFSRTREQTSGEFKTLGANRAVVLTGETYGDRLTMRFRCRGNQAHRDVMLLLDAERTLVIQDDLGDQWYIRPSGDVATAIVQTATRVSNPLRWVTVTAVEVSPPNA